MPTDEIAGTEVAGYRIESVIGRGGMGVVYLAEHIRLKRKVAVKVLAPELVQDEGFRERFARESELAASLEHPNVVPVHDAGEAEGLLYIAMRFVEGTDLETLIQREGALDPDRTAGLISQIASALDAAHARGLIHRDVKPANVLLDGLGHAYLTDFGLTKRPDQVKGFTRTGQFMGSVDYAAPEQFEGKPLDARTDVYSLAAVAYACLTGTVPFPRDQEAATMFAHLKEPPPLVSETRPGLPPELDHIVSRGLAKDPEDRFTTAGAFGAAMSSALAPADRERGARAPGEPAPLPPANLPVPRSSFVGRARETVEIGDLLSHLRLVTLTGAGGSGKTRLAIEVADRERGRFPGGPWWLDLSPLTEADAVPRAAASALGLSEEHGRPPIDVVAETIGTADALLLVDNCEHLLGAAAAFVEGILEACPGLRILATSRQPLGIPDERA